MLSEGGGVAATVAGGLAPGGGATTIGALSVAVAAVPPAFMVGRGVGVGGVATAGGSARVTVLVAASGSVMTLAVASVGLPASGWRMRSLSSEGATTAVLTAPP